MDRIDREIAKAKENDEMAKRVGVCQELDSLTDWEEEFLDDIRGVLEKGFELSTSQLDKLQEIEDERDY